MIDIPKYNNEVSCWVYLQKDKEGDYDISFSLDLPGKISREEEDLNPLVYVRRFNNIIDGIGHKLLLESISKPSLQRMIRINNPENKDLKLEVINTYRTNHTMPNQ
ncbi:hypothetical protein LJB84_00700 [Bacteroidales bacterium OttesenSCG-928-J19]|nr:hypothetical protein [Bacteroidales bacterium OttesenSCG-928-J19]